MELLKMQIPLLYVILKTFWDILSVGVKCLLIFAVASFFVWLLNRVKVSGGFNG